MEEHPLIRNRMQTEIIFFVLLDIEPTMLPFPIDFMDGGRRRTRHSAEWRDYKMPEE
jgi:hypothetical protein